MHMHIRSFFFSWHPNSERTGASDLLFSGESESKFGALVRNSENLEYRSEIESENPRSVAEGKGRRGKEDGGVCVSHLEVF